MIESKFYKNIKELPTDYFEKLAEYIKNNTVQFCTNEATSESDYNYFKTIKSDRDHLVKYGELMIVDLEHNDLGRHYGHWYAVCQVTRRRYKLENGRVVELKVISWVADIESLKYGDWKNGYFLLPRLDQKEDK